MRASSRPAISSSEVLSLSCSSASFLFCSPSCSSRYSADSFDCSICSSSFEMLSLRCSISFSSTAISESDFELLSCVSWISCLSFSASSAFSALRSKLSLISRSTSLSSSDSSEYCCCTDASFSSSSLPLLKYSSSFLTQIETSSFLFSSSSTLNFFAFSDCCLKGSIREASSPKISLSLEILSSAARSFLSASSFL